MNAFAEEDALPPDKRYIRACLRFPSEDGNGYIYIIVCIVGSLADLFHIIPALVCDNTYKRIHGTIWKEHEIVVFEAGVNTRE